MYCHFTFHVNDMKHNCKAQMINDPPSLLSIIAWRRFLELKQMLLDIEASVPISALRYRIDNLDGEITAEQRQKVRVMVAGWETERRAEWIGRVSRSITPLQLYALAKVLESTIDARWLHPPAANGTAASGADANPSAAATTGEGGDANITADISYYLPEPQDVSTIARLALKIFSLDRDIRYEHVA